MRKQIKTAVKWSVAAVAFALIAVILTGYFLGWFTKKATPMSENSSLETGGMELPDTVEGSGVSLMSAVIPKAQYAAYEVSPAAETAKTLTATINGDATHKVVSWSVAFENASSEWATGKTVTEYVTVQSSGELTATVSCLKAFGERIIVTARAIDDTSKFATCNVEYEQKLIGLDFIATSSQAKYNITKNDAQQGENWGTLGWNTTYTFSPVARKSDGTVEKEYTVQDMGLKLWAFASQTLKSNGYTAGQTAPLGITAGSETNLDNGALTVLFGSNAVGSYQLYQALQAMRGSFENILEVTVSFKDAGGFTGYLFVDYKSVYVPINEVGITDSTITF